MYMYMYMFLLILNLTVSTNQALVTDNIFSFLIDVHYRKVFAILHLVSRYFIQL